MEILQAGLTWVKSLGFECLRSFLVSLQVAIRHSARWLGLEETLDRCGNEKQMFALALTLLVMCLLWWLGVLECIGQSQEDMIMGLATPKQRRIVEKMQKEHTCCRRRRARIDEDSPAVAGAQEIEKTHHKEKDKKEN
mmetsp:Transcript_121869/g.191269  ORF Transcript_121869/g.191269 Transcript_121869/m.191269 type:complete len:138 (-) Transcript_121869:46-459(-)